MTPEYLDAKMVGVADSTPINDIASIKDLIKRAKLIFRSEIISSRSSNIDKPKEAVL